MGTVVILRGKKAKGTKEEGRRSHRGGTQKGKKGEMRSKEKGEISYLQTMLSTGSETVKRDRGRRQIRPLKKKRKYRH